MEGSTVYVRRGESVGRWGVFVPGAPMTGA
jgi:hypothetical protein